MIGSLNLLVHVLVSTFETQARLETETVTLRHNGDTTYEGHFR